MAGRLGGLKIPVSAVRFRPRPPYNFLISLRIAIQAKALDIDFGRELADFDLSADLNNA